MGRRVDDSRVVTKYMIQRIFNKIFGTKHTREIIEKVNQLPISDSGVDGGDPFVKLENGTILFGARSRIYDSAYRFLDKGIKSKLSKDCIQVAADVVIRYVEGGLQYSGPKKQSRYTVQAGDRVSEMGGYQGFCSVKLAQQVGPEGSVVAIEPMADNFRLLERNKHANQLDQLTVVNRAVWDTPKMVQFQRRKGDGQSSSVEMGYKDGDTYDVPAETLDQIYRNAGVEPVDFMIIQLNGAEINGLRGLTDFAPRHLSIAARYDTEGEDAALAIKKLLIERNYEVEIDQEDFVFAKLKAE